MFLLSDLKLNVKVSRKCNILDKSVKIWTVAVTFCWECHRLLIGSRVLGGYLTTVRGVIDTFFRGQISRKRQIRLSLWINRRGPIKSSTKRNQIQIEFKLEQFPPLLHLFFFLSFKLLEMCEAYKRNKNSASQKNWVWDNWKAFVRLGN